MNALRNGKVREYPPPTAKKRRQEENSETHAQSTKTEDRDSSAEHTSFARQSYQHSVAVQPAVSNVAPVALIEPQEQNTSIESNVGFTTPMQSPIRIHKMPNNNETATMTSQNGENADLFAQVFVDDDLVAEDQHIIETNAKYNSKLALQQITSLINEAATLALSIQKEPQGKLAILEEFLPQFELDCRSTFEVAASNVAKLNNNAKVDFETDLTVKKAQVQRIVNRFHSKIEVLKVLEPVPIPHLLQMRQDGNIGRATSTRNPNPTPPNGNANGGVINNTQEDSEDNEDTDNEAAHHNNGLGSNSSNDLAPQVGGLRNSERRPYSPRGHLENGVYTQQGNPTPNAGFPNNHFYNRRRQRQNGESNVQAKPQLLQQNIAKTAVAGEDGNEDIYLNVNDRRNSQASKFPPIIMNESESITEEYFFSTFPAPFNTPPHREQRCDNGELLQTARNLAPVNLDYENYSKFIKNFKVTIHAVRMDYELKINCLRACFPNHEFFGDGNSMLDYRKMIVRMNLRFGTVRRASQFFMKKFTDRKEVDLRHYAQVATFHNDLQAFQTALSIIGETRLFLDDNKYAIIIESLSAFSYHDFQNFLEARGLQPGMKSLITFVSKQELTARQYFEVKQNNNNKPVTSKSGEIDVVDGAQGVKSFAQTGIADESDGEDEIAYMTEDETIQLFANKQEKPVKVECYLLQCEENHQLFNCPVFLEMEVERKETLLRKLQLCKFCFQRNHTERHCKKTRFLCKKEDCSHSEKHHFLLHKENDRIT